MKAEILATGDEIRSGALIDSNSAYISERLEESGIEVVRHTSVGDDLPMLVSTLREIGQRADVAFVTGGLGPTTDDRCAEAAAKAAGIELALNLEALENVERFFKTFKRPMTESNRKQALLPVGCKILHNPVGTAPGFFLKIGMCHFFFLPGVPYEMKRMFAGQAIQAVKAFQGDAIKHSRVKTISTFGLPESLAGEKVADVEAAFPGIKLGLRANFPQIHIKLYGRDTDLTMLDQRIAEAGQWVLERLGKNVISENGEKMEAVVGRLLIERSASIGLAESCTGGLLSNWLTNVAGSSAYFRFSAVTYSNQAKIDALGVKSDTLKRHGAVHEITAKEMAVGVQRVAGATYGLSTTGIAGPDGGTEDKPVGTVCVGYAGPDRSFGRRLYFPFGRRLMNKKIFCMAAMDILRKELLGIA